MTWTDFETESALERDTLQRALPLSAISSDQSSTVEIDMADIAAPLKIGLTFSETLGATPSGCIELLRIRPLLVGCAWKIVDLLLETAFEEAGYRPGSGHRWIIKEKTRLAQDHAGNPTSIPSAAWAALTSTYEATKDVRHSLVHRKAYTDPSGALIGVDDQGAQIRPLTVLEQEAFARTSLRSSQLVIQPHNTRVEADLIRQLSILAGVHNEPLPSVGAEAALPEIAVVVHPKAGSTKLYDLDVPSLWGRQPFKQATHADLIVKFSDRPGQEARGQLEDAPREVVSINPDDLPRWLN